jgi:hypothetical protein
MEYLALIHADENGRASLSDDERQAVYQRYIEFSQKPEVVGGAELQSTNAATTVRVRNGDQLVTDGRTVRSRSGPSTCERRAEMRYALMIYSDQEPWLDLSEEEAAKRSEESLPKWYVFFEELGKADPEMSGKELDDIRTAKTVRVRDGEVLVTDGPFAETKEQIGGFFDTNLPDLDTAIAYAAKIPASEYGSIEVRPVVERP